MMPKNLWHSSKPVIRGGWKSAVNNSDLQTSDLISHAKQAYDCQGIQNLGSGPMHSRRIF
jgi:hypothetical protein